MTDTNKQKSGEQRTVKPGAAVQLLHRINDTVAMAEPVAVELDLSTASIASDVSVRIEVDDNLELLSERNTWQLSLAADKAPETLAVTVALQSGEKGYIRVFVTEEAGNRSRTFTVPVQLPGAASVKSGKQEQGESPGIIEMPAEETSY